PMVQRNYTIAIPLELNPQSTVISWLKRYSRLIFVDFVGSSLLNIYFQNSGEMILRNQQKLVGNTSPTSLLQWIENLILVGWQLCSSVEP
ncbi:MAG: hypothetical protein ACKPFF_21660, partial [Planktothrix sp.]